MIKTTKEELRLLSEEAEHLYEKVSTVITEYVEKVGDAETFKSQIVVGVLVELLIGIRHAEISGKIPDEESVVLWGLECLSDVEAKAKRKSNQW